MKTQNGVNSWLRTNLWNLIITTIAIIIAFVTLSSRVTALEIEQAQFQTRLTQYPSEDYFDLKFKTIEASLSEVKADLKQHIEATQ